MCNKSAKWTFRGSDNDDGRVLRFRECASSRLAVSCRAYNIYRGCITGSQEVLSGLYSAEMRDLELNESMSQYYSFFFFFLGGGGGVGWVC